MREDQLHRPLAGLVRDRPVPDLELDRRKRGQVSRESIKGELSERDHTHRLRCLHRAEIGRLRVKGDELLGHRYRLAAQEVQMLDLQAEHLALAQTATDTQVDDRLEPLGELARVASITSMEGDPRAAAVPPVASCPRTGRPR